MYGAPWPPVLLIPIWENKFRWRRIYVQNVNSVGRMMAKMTKIAKGEVHPTLKILYKRHLFCLPWVCVQIFSLIGLKCGLWWLIKTVSDFFLKWGILVPPGHNPQRTRMTMRGNDNIDWSIGEGVGNISTPKCFAPSLSIFDWFSQTPLSSRIWKEIGV